MKKFKIARPNIVYQTIEEEVVIVDLKDGFYYSLTKSGAYIWERLIAGLSKESITEELVSLYEGKREEIAKAVNDLIARLEKERLIAQTTEPAAAPNQNLASLKKSFLLPEFVKFTDMQDALKLDPLHEVDAAGWPIPNKIQDDTNP